MPSRAVVPLVLALLLLAGCASTPRAVSQLAARSEVLEAEAAFAATLAARDPAAFAAHLSDEAVFFSGAQVLEGREAVVAGWARYFEGPEAPFSWAPGDMTVLPSGRLAHSSGPVFDPAGRRIAEFNSVWRLEGDGRWRVVFDKGCRVCPD